MRKRPNPTMRRSLDLLTAEGWLAEQVEHNQRHSVNTNDLFGFIDIIAIRPGATLAVQTTDATNVNARVDKIRTSLYFDAVRAAGWRIVVHGWRPEDYIGRLGPLRVVDLTAAA